MRSLRPQLLLSHLLLVLLMGVVMSGVITNFSSLGQSIDRVLRGNFQTVLASQELNSALFQQETSWALLANGKSSDAREQYNTSRIAFDQAFSIVSSSAHSGQGVQLAGAMGTAWMRYRSVSDTTMAKNNFTLQPELEAVTTEVIKPLLKEMHLLAHQILMLNEEQILAYNNDARQEAYVDSKRGLVVTGIAVVIAVLLALRMVRMALTPLAQLTEQANRIGSGNLQPVSITRKDEIGQLGAAFNDMAQKLSEARRIESRRLQRAERMSDAAIDSLYDPVIVIDSHQRIVHLNRAAEGLFGPAPVSPRVPLSDHVKDRRILRAIDDAVDDQRVTASEDETGLVPIHVGGSERIYRIRATPMKDDDDNLLGGVLVLDDVTHLRTLDRLKTEFIGVASHELRTPVTSLMLSVDLLKDGAVGQLTPPQRQIVEAQREDLGRLDKLMRDLLDVTRLEAGSSPPRLELISPSLLVKRPMTMLKPSADEAHVSLIDEVDPSLPQVRADQAQIGRVLNNLMANAIRHTPAGGTVTIRAIADGDHVTFSVKDTGEGIPPEYRDRIFERFVQVPGATQGGAGLGLSIAQNIVKAHGGQMSVNSEVGKGSTFRFTLAVDKIAEGEA